MKESMLFDVQLPSCDAIDEGMTENRITVATVETLLEQKEILGWLDCSQGNIWNEY